MQVTTTKHRKLLLEAFPGTSSRLISFLKHRNRALKKLPAWRIQQIENFIKTLNVTAIEIERARREQRMSALAWSARNFLELSIWIDYCCASEANANRFKEDTRRDLYGMVAAGKGTDLSGKLQEELDELLQRLERIFNTGSFKVTDEFKKVSKAALEIGREKEFFSYNKLLSKMAHPTAFMVHAKKGNLFGRQFLAVLYIQGVSLALKSMITLVDFMFANFPEAEIEKQLSMAYP